MYQAIVFLPIVASAIAGLFGRIIGARPSELITTGALFVSAALSAYVFYDVCFLGHSAIVNVAPWIHSGAFAADWTIRVDSLTAVMLVVVTGVSSLVHLYSFGYMADDDSRARFFSFLSLFTFMMLMLVTANNFLQMFFGWEGVGLASYLLIGFWYKKPEANAAAMKAFIVNRVGDFGFILGIFGVWAMFGSLDFDTVFAARAVHGRKDHAVRQLACRYPDHALPAAVRRRDGQVGAARAPHLVAGRDGRPDAGLRADPCRDHGDGRRVPGLPLLAAV